MTNVEDELIRDRFITGIGDDQLRAYLLNQKKKNGYVVIPREGVKKPETWEASTRLNAQLIDVQWTIEQVSLTKKQRDKLLYPSQRSRVNGCAYFGPPEQHSRGVCPDSKPGVYCHHCHSRNHFTSVCRSPKDHSNYGISARNF